MNNLEEAKKAMRGLFIYELFPDDFTLDHLCSLREHNPDAVILVFSIVKKEEGSGQNLCTGLVNIRELTVDLYRQLDLLMRTSEIRIFTARLMLPDVPPESKEEKTEEPEKMEEPDSESPLVLNEENVRELYLNQNLTAVECAKRFHMPKPTFVRYLSDHMISKKPQRPRCPRGSQKTTEE